MADYSVKYHCNNDQEKAGRAHGFPMREESFMRLGIFIPEQRGSVLKDQIWLRDTPNSMRE